MNISRFGLISAAMLTAAAVGTACGSTPSAQPHMATVSGTFVIVGGPAPGSPRPTAGTVTFVNSGGRATDVTAGSNGNFRVKLTEGVYSLSGRNGSNECLAGSVHLTTASPPPVQVACEVP
jgi:hypothetical protein